MRRHCREGESFADEILNNIGAGFWIGTVTASPYYLVKGMYNSPNGIGSRLLGGSQAVRMNAPLVGGACAAWFGIDSVFGYSLVSMRQKEDPWNSIISSAATAGFLSLRQGLRASARSAASLAIFSALLEGALIIIDHKFIDRSPATPALVHRHSRP